jgi:polar amino acid transport system substrate-binding protein
VLAIGTRKDAPLLNDILQKALDDLSSEELHKIFYKWVSSQQETGDEVQLSMDQRLWVQQHPVVSIGFDENFPPYSFRNEQGQIVGIAVDFAREVAQRIGLKLEVNPEGEWKTLYQAAQSKELDVIATMVRRKDRERWFGFSQPYLSLNYYIVTRKDREQEFTAPDDLAGKKVALVTGYTMSKPVLDEVDDISPVFFSTQLEALKAVSSGEADAAVGSLGVIKYLLAGADLPNLSLAGLYSRRQAVQRFAVRKDWPQLVALLNKGIESISEDDIAAIFSRWSSSDVAMAEMVNIGSVLDLSDQEKQWLADHPVIRTASDPAWAPIEFVENGEFKGISADYLKKLEQLLNIKFEQEKAQTWAELMLHYQRGEIDVFTALNQTPQRREMFLFTNGYTSFSNAIFSGPDVNYIGDLNELNGRRVVVVHDYAVQELLVMDYPDIQLISARDTEQALLQLARGEADAYVGNILVTGYYIGKLGLNQIKIVGETPYRFEQSMGVRKDWPLLVSILNKALAAISEQEKSEIYNKWIRIGYDYGFDYSLLWKILAVVFVVFVVFIYWNRKLAVLNTRLVEANQHEEQARIQLEKANEKLKEMDKLKSMFIASMSHELRTPLNSIIGFSGLMMQGITGELNSKQQDSVQRINKAGTHLLSLISDVIDISKIEAGRIDSHVELFSLKDLLEDAIESIRPLADKKGLMLEVDSDVWPEVMTDRKRLLQCLLNYLSNAVKFTEHGSIRITVIARDDRIEVSVTDTGIGIAKEDLPKLFEAFERLESHLRIKAGGTGLGLYLTRKITQDILQGDVSVVSRPNQGSTFRLEFATRIEQSSNAGGHNDG